MKILMDGLLMSQTIKKIHNRIILMKIILRSRLKKKKLIEKDQDLLKKEKEKTKILDIKYLKSTNEKIPVILEMNKIKKRKEKIDIIEAQNIPEEKKDDREIEHLLVTGQLIVIVDLVKENQIVIIDQIKSIG